MEESLNLRESPQVQELILTLERENLPQQKEAVVFLVEYLDSMEKRLSEMSQEIRSMRGEVQGLKNRNLREKCSALVSVAEKKATQAKQWFSTVKKNFLRSVGNVLQGFQELGKAGLLEGVRMMRIPTVISKLGDGFETISVSLYQCSGRLDTVRKEWEQAKNHLYGAKQAMLGKEQGGTKESTVLSKLEKALDAWGDIFFHFSQNTQRVLEKVSEPRSVREKLHKLKMAQPGKHFANKGKELSR